MQDGIFLMVGVGVCGAAVWALYDGRASETAAGRAGLCAVCAWAAALAAGAVCALAGALRHSASLLAAAFALLALSGVAEGAAAWWGSAHGESLRGALQAALARAVREEYGAVESRTAALDAIQAGLRCCGAAGAGDWRASAWARLPERALDLTVRAPAAHYPVPASCCVSPGGAECEAARRVPAAWGGGARAGLHAAGCGARVPAALAAAARAPLAAAAALAAAHAAALLLALALCLRDHPRPAYKA